LGVHFFGDDSGDGRQVHSADLDGGHTEIKASLCIHKWLDFHCEDKFYFFDGDRDSEEDGSGDESQLRGGEFGSVGFLWPGVSEKDIICAFLGKGQVERLLSLGVVVDIRQQDVGKVWADEFIVGDLGWVVAGGFIENQDQAQG